MRKENYREEIDFTDEQIKIDRKRDPAIDYSYEYKGSIFKKISKDMAEKKMHKEGYNEKISSSNDYDFGDYYDSNNYYSESDYDDIDFSYSNKDYDDSQTENNKDLFNKSKSWIEKNSSRETKELFNNLKKEYKNTQKNAEESRSRGLSDENKSLSSKNKKSKKSGYKICKNCGTQMYKDAKICPRCGEEQKSKSTAGFVISKVFKLILILMVINLVIGVVAFIFTGDKEISYEEEISSEEPYIGYEEYSKPVQLKYNVNAKDVLKIDKEKFEVGREIPAGEYIFVKNESDVQGSIKIFTENDKSNPELLEIVHRNYYVKLEEGDTVELREGTLYKADQVELDMSNENNLKSGMYRLGKDVGDEFTIEGNSKTYYAILDENNIIITNGFVDDGAIFIDKAFIEDSSMQGEVAKYVYVSNGIIVPE